MSKAGKNRQQAKKQKGKSKLAHDEKVGGGDDVVEVHIRPGEPEGDGDVNAADVGGGPDDGDIFESEAGEGDATLRSFLFEEPGGTSQLSWYDGRDSDGREDGRGKRSPVGTAVGKNECEGRPGVRCAHVQRIVRFGADFPGRVVEVVQFVAFFDCACGVSL